MVAKTKIYCGFPSTGVIADLQPYILRDIVAEYGDKVELVYPPHLAHRIFHDSARNAIVEEFLKTDCDILWFLDSDVVPPRHVMGLVTEHGDKWQVAGGVYPVFMGQSAEEHRQIVFTVYKSEGEGMYPSRIPYEGIDFVEGIATGCLFIKREVLEKMDKPYFEFKYDPITRDLKEGEDLGFCKKLQSKGIKFFVDYSVVCKHYKNVDLLELNNYAIEYAKKAVAAYDQDVREKVAAAVKAAYHAGKMSQPPQSKSQLILPPGMGSLSSR